MGSKADIQSSKSR